MSKRSRRNTDPVTVAEVSAAVLRMLVREFAGRPLDGDTARRGLVHANHDLITAELREVGRQEAARKAAVKTPGATVTKPRQLGL
jgi:hypothetical protein